MLRLISLSAVLAATAGLAVADITAEFDEGAPKDRLIITNTGNCSYSDFAVELDLEPSAGKLIFDVSDQGAGVEVFQPFEIVSGTNALKSAPIVTDGQKGVSFEFTGLEPGQALVVTSDVDDTIGAREITVTGQEFEGSVLTVYIDGKTLDARFGPKPVAMVALPDC